MPSAPADRRSPVDAPGRTVGLVRSVGQEIRWSFQPPGTWLQGVLANLVLSLLWLLASPITGAAHTDWVIIVGTYFAVFVLADVTTTNVLGPDAARTQLALADGVSPFRILLVKNLTLMAIVGLPTLIATAAFTMQSEGDYRLSITLPGVAFPILTWIGVGSIVSVLLPVATAPLRQRWQQRHDLRSTALWAGHLALPYGLLYAVDPVTDAPRFLLRRLPEAVRTLQFRGLILLVLGIGLWLLGLGIASIIAQRRGVRFY